MKAAPTLADALGSSADRLLLVSPPESSRVPEPGASFRVNDVDAGAIHRTAREVRIVCSDNDPYNPAGARAFYGEPLGIESTIVSGAGHITPADGYGPWPALAAWCEQADSRLLVVDA